MTVSESAWLAERFEEHRGQLRAVAYRMLGSLAEADDAVQEAWIRLSRSDAAVIENLGGWLTDESQVDADRGWWDPFAGVRVIDGARRRPGAYGVCRAALLFEGLRDARPGVTPAPAFAGPLVCQSLTRRR